MKRDTRSMRHRSIGAAAIAVAAITCIAACGSSETPPSDQPSAASSGASSAASSAPAEKVVLDFPNFQNIEKPYATWWSEFLDAYQDKYPEVTVKVSSVSNSAALQELATTRFAAGNPPDIIQAATGSFASFADAGYLMPLDDVLADTNVPDGWGELQKAFEWNGETLGVMSLSSALVLHYNQKLLDAAGAKVPTTPEELIASAKAVNDPAKGVYGFAGVTAGADTAMQNQGGAFVYGMGGAWFDDCAPNFTDSTTESALDAYRQVMQYSPKGMQGNQAKTLFGSGKAAFLIEKASYASTIADEASADMKGAFGAAKLPFENSAGNANVYLAIPKGLSGAKLEAAENFIKLAVSPEWQKKYAETIGAPAPDPNATEELVKDDPQMQLFTDLTAKAVNILPTCPDVAVKYPVFQKEIYDALTKIATTDVAINSVTQDLQQSVDKQLGQG